MASNWVCVATLLAVVACTPTQIEEPRPYGSGMLTLVHHDKMGASFRLKRLVYQVDGQRVFERDDLAIDQPIVVLTQMMPAGAHDVHVTAVYRGNGHGVFKYLNKYKFTVKSKHTVTIVDREHVQLEVTAFEKGGVTTPLEQRPAIDFRATAVGPVVNPY